MVVGREGGGEVLCVVGSTDSCNGGSTRCCSRVFKTFPALHLHHHHRACSSPLSPFVPVCAYVQLATTLERLTKLNMSRVSGISLQGVRGFTALRELDLSRCDQLTSSALTAALESFE